MVLVGTISAVLALAALVAGTLAITRLSAARAEMIDKLDPALLNSQRLNSGLLNQETAVRGFALTGDPETLRPYELGRQQQTDSLAALRVLGGQDGRPELTTALDEVERLSAQWRREYAEPTVAAVRAGGPRTPAFAVDAGRGSFDALRAELDGQRTALARARTEARTALADAVTTLTVTALSIGIGLVLLLGALAMWVRGTISRPISTLAASVREVADGQFERRPVGSGPKEIVQLADDVDSMRERILSALRDEQELNAQLNRQTRDLERSNRDLEQFAYVASHDLQEPLRKVSGFCELLKTRYGGQLDARADQYIDFAVDGARRMSRLISDLLAFSRVGRVPAAPEELDGEALVAQAVRNLEAQIAETGAGVTHDPLPTVRGESALLTTVFQNLIGNAVKFRGAEPPTVHVGVARRDGDWEFRVSDNGIGIDPAYAEKVFVIFQRLHPKEQYPGTGIGLALCRKIIEYHGGTIWLDPAPGAGTTFRFTLPVAGSEAPDGDRRASSGAGERQA
jgi:signal transduction histidine kinase